MYRTGGKSEFDTFFLKAAEYPKINRLLNVHEGYVVRRLHVIHYLEIECGIAEPGKVCPVEPGMLLHPDDFLHHARDTFEFLRRRVVGHPQRKDDAPLLHPLVVSYPAGKQIAVGNHDLFPGQTAQARRLQTNFLDGPQRISHDQKIAYLEWLVEHDRERGKQIPEDILHGERHGDTTYPEPGDKRREVNAEVVQCNEKKRRIKQQTGKENRSPAWT